MAQALADKRPAAIDTSELTGGSPPPSNPLRRHVVRTLAELFQAWNEERQKCENSPDNG